MFKKILNYSLFFLFAFFFAGGQSFASASVHEEASLIHKDNTCHLCEDIFISAHFPFHTPLGSLPIENEKQPTSEEELKDNLNDARDLFVLKNLFQRILNTSGTVKNHFYQRIQSIQNRSTVPLFILFLSWKSFLL